MESYQPTSYIPAPLNTAFGNTTATKQLYLNGLVMVESESNGTYPTSVFGVGNATLEPLTPKMSIGKTLELNGGIPKILHRDGIKMLCVALL